MESHIQNLSNSLSLKSETELEKNLSNDLPLEEYLKNPDAIQCFINMKENAQKYFDRNKMKQLIKYIIEIPKEDENNKKYNFPYIVSEMLKSANNRIKEMIIFPEEVFDKIYKQENHNHNDIDNNKDNTKNNEIINTSDEKKEDNNNENKNDNLELKHEINENKNEINENKNDKIEIKEEKEVKREEKAIRKFNIEKHCELFDLLLDFTKNENSLKNDVLCGYFSKVLISLLDSYPIDIFLYLYLMRPDAVEEIIMNSYNRSLSLISKNILDVDNYKLKISDNNKKNPGMINMKFIEKKEKEMKKFCLKLLEILIISIDLSKYKYKKIELNLSQIDIESIFLMFEELIKNFDLLLDIIFEENIVEHFFKILEMKITLKNRKIYLYFFHLLIKIIKELGPIIESKKKIYPEFNLGNVIEKFKDGDFLEFSEKSLIHIPIIISKNFIILSKENYLGIHNIYMIDLMIEFFKYLIENPNFFDFICLQTEFMEKSIEYFFKCQLNNIYHNKFINLFTLYLQKGEKHPLLTDYFFFKKNFHIMLAKSLNDKKYKNIFVFIIDLMYKIQVACNLELLDEKTRKDLKIINYGYFEFIKDEKTPEKMRKLKLPKYIGDILSQSQEWNSAIKNIVIPKIKKYEGNLVRTKLIRSKSLNNNNSGIKVVLGKTKNKYNDINYWKTNDKIFDNIKIKINSDINKKENINVNDEENDLLCLAMKLENKK